MTILAILTIALSVFAILYGLKEFKIDDEIRDFLKPVLSWIVIGFVSLMVYRFLGGG